jgi:hypothetical protein
MHAASFRHFVQHCSSNGQLESQCCRCQVVSPSIMGAPFLNSYKGAGLRKSNSCGCSDDSIYRQIDISTSISIYRIVSISSKTISNFRYIAIFFA